MIRKIITIDGGKCNGCGLCVSACHEGAIGLEDGRAVLLRDDYCDGLGDCLPACPTGAITFEEREALAYDEAAVQENMRLRAAGNGAPHGSCAGVAQMSLRPLGAEGGAGAETPANGLPLGSNSFGGIASRMPSMGTPHEALKEADETPRNVNSNSTSAAPSQLAQWPVQIKLAPLHAPYFQGADLLIAADCSAFAFGDFHARFMKGKVTLIGCPKLDEGDYSQKLSAIIKANDIKSVTIVRMTVPCCGGLERAAAQAVHDSGKDVPVHLSLISPDGRIAQQ